MAPTGSVGGATGGSWQKYTDYGPTIDPKGNKYYDSESYNGIGAYGKLRNGDAAMNPAWAWSHYHVKPGGTSISDRDGKEHRFRDRTGAKNPQNEDFYHGASAETHVHFHIDAIDGASVHSFLSSHGDSIADTVHRHLSDRLSRQAAV